MESATRIVYLKHRNEILALAVIFLSGVSTLTHICPTALDLKDLRCIGSEEEREGKGRKRQQQRL